MALLFINFLFSGGIWKNSSAGYNRKVPKYTEFLWKIKPRRKVITSAGKIFMGEGSLLVTDKAKIN